MFFIVEKSSLFVLFILILLAPCAYSQADQEAQLVSTAYAKSEQMKPVMWVTGNVVSRYDADISSEQSGQLLFLLDVGSKVEKNAVVAQLDDRDLQLQLQQLLQVLQLRVTSLILIISCSFICFYLVNF